MQIPPGVAIQSLDEATCAEFFEYFDQQRSDNGRDGGSYFMPLPRNEWRFPLKKQQSFREGLRLAIGSTGWRRAWFARATDRRIVGHVDLRSHPMRGTEHRCLLGLGVDRNHRRLGLGRALLEHATDWALADTSLEWIDLEVLSENQPAVRLYLQTGFVKVGEISEMFKLDGHVFSWTTMTKRLRESSKANS